MALTTITGGLWVGPVPIQGTPGLAFDSQSLVNTTRQRVEWIVEIPKTGTLDKIEVYVGFVSSPSDVKFSFQDVDTSTGNADGSVDQFRVVTGGSISVGWLVPGLITSDGTDGGSKRSVTRGNNLAIVAEWDTTQTGECWFYGVGNFSNTQLAQFPYGGSHNGASWTKHNGAAYHTLVFKYNDATYECAQFTYPVSAMNTRTFNSGSTPDERALFFSFPVSVSIDAIEYYVDLDNDADLVLYDTNGTSVLLTRSLDSSIQPGLTPHPRRITFDPITLIASSNYRIAMKPGASNVSTYEVTVASTAIMNAMCGGSGWYLSTRTDAGSWTETTTQRPFASVRVAQIEASSGGGQRSYVG